MQHRIPMLILVALLVIITLLFAACGSGSTGTQTTVATSATTAKTTEVTSTIVASAAATTAASTLTQTTAATTQNTTVVTGGSSDWSGILAKLAAVTSVKYDMVTTSPDGSQTTANVWMTQHNMKTRSTIEGMETIIYMDFDAKTIITYTPSENMALKMESDDTESVTDVSSSQEQAVVVGTETLDGKLCIIVEYNDGDIKVKAWYWQEKGFPLRIENTTTEGKYVMEMKNIDFSTIAASEFELPAGVTITDMANFSIPTLPTDTTDYSDVVDEDTGE